MTEILAQQSQNSLPAKPRQIPGQSGLKLSSPLSTTQPISTAQSGTPARNIHLNLDTFSPVNQNGSFEFDRVLKSGIVHKRTRKTKTWKPIYLVLRPNLLSIYKNAQETKLRHQIDLSELTAVAFLKDRKQKREHMFGLFSPSKNYHLQAHSHKDAQEWVDLIRREARIEEEEEEMFLASPGGFTASTKAVGKRVEGHRRVGDERLGSSSPEPTELPLIGSKPSMTRDGVRIPSMVSQTLDYSGNELGSYSDLSDSGLPGGGVRGSSSLSLPQQENAGGIERDRADVAPNMSQASGLGAGHEEERVVWHGYLLALTSKAKVRQWKKTWVVLRPKHVAFYKNDEEYSAHLIIPLSSIINAVEIDPISKSKTHCMQLIAEEKSYRFCAPDEDSLDKWLGALKSLLAKRKEADRRRAAQGALVPPAR